MTRTARRLTEEGYYHVMQRGAGRQAIFEDEDDRLYYLNLLKRKFGRAHIKIHSYCLMDNHTHLLIEDEGMRMSQSMHDIATGYAMRFKGKTGLVGPVFQGRYESVPITSDKQLLTAVRYIHDNPCKAGIGTLANYRWSSFGEYITGTPDICHIDTILELTGGVEGFYHLSTSGTPNPYCFKHGSRIPEEDCLEVAAATVLPIRLGDIKTLERKSRDHQLRVLRSAGLTLKQIEMATGIGYGTVHKACA